MTFAFARPLIYDVHDLVGMVIFLLNGTDQGLVVFRKKGTSYESFQLWYISSFEVVEVFMRGVLLGGK